MARAEHVSFDLVVASVGRTQELERLLDSLTRQTHRTFRVLLVDQTGDDRLSPVLHAYSALDVIRLRSERGLSRARNAALGHVHSDIVAFPDDDCVIPPDLLRQIAGRLVDDPALDGLTGRVADEAGVSSQSWKRDATILTRDNLWNRAVSVTIFLRASVVGRVGLFDEQLGLGAGTLWSSGEEIDYLVRAIDQGARIQYDPDLVVGHPNVTFSSADLCSIGLRDGASVGYILRKNGYPHRTVARMIARPTGGAVLALARGDVTRARFQMSTLRGRVAGYGRSKRAQAAS